MKQTICTLFILALLLAPAAVFAQDDDFDHKIEKIDWLWTKRSGDTKAAQEAVRLAEEAYGLKPGYEAAWRAARACFWIADRSEDRDVDQKWGKRGYEWGEKAIKAKPSAPEGYYYYAISLAEYGKGISIVSALAKGLGGDFEKNIGKAIQMKPGLEHAGPNRALGRYYYAIPWPKYDSKKSEENLKKSLALAPNFGRTYYYLAQLYAKEKQYDKAREILQKLQTISNPTDSVWENNYYKSVGKDLLNELKDK